MAKRNKVSGRGVESLRSLEAKWKALYCKVVDETATEFELSMFKAFEKSLGEKRYFDKKRMGMRRHPIFWVKAQ